MGRKWRGEMMEGKGRGGKEKRIGGDRKEGEWRGWK